MHGIVRPKPNKQGGDEEKEDEKGDEKEEEDLETVGGARA